MTWRRPPMARARSQPCLVTAITRGTDSVAAMLKPLRPTARQHDKGARSLTLALDLIHLTAHAMSYWLCGWATSRTSVSHSLDERRGSLGPSPTFTASTRIHIPLPARLVRYGYDHRPASAAFHGRLPSTGDVLEPSSVAAAPTRPLLVSWASEPAMHARWWSKPLSTPSDAGSVSIHPSSAPAIQSPARVALDPAALRRRKMRSLPPLPAPTLPLPSPPPHEINESELVRTDPATVTDASSSFGSRLGRSKQRTEPLHSSILRAHPRQRLCERANAGAASKHDLGSICQSARTTRAALSSTSTTRRKMQPAHRHRSARRWGPTTSAFPPRRLPR